MHKNFWWENRKERGRLEARDVDGEITLKFITRGCVLDWINAWGEQMVGSFEHRNELLATMRCGEFLDYLKNW